MTYLSHCHPSFGSVFSIEAVNEPIMNATQTPGLGECKSRASCPRLIRKVLLTHRTGHGSPEEFCPNCAIGRGVSPVKVATVPGSESRAEDRGSARYCPSWGSHDGLAGNVAQTRIEGFHRCFPHVT
jgi:hypothetical protein